MKVFFPNLNPLRAIGAITVAFSHIELSKHEMGYADYFYSTDFFHNTGGHLGVTLFFVLSGFLITYLLLAEKDSFGTINVYTFFIRRTLRIWPIYYLMVFFTLFVFPYLLTSYPGRLTLDDTRFWPVFLTYLFLVPNVQSMGLGGAGGIFQLSTIGTEEQFYWMWPFLVKYTRHIGAILIAIAVFITFLPHMIGFAIVHFAHTPLQKDILTKVGLFLPHFKINSMAFGGLAAYIYFRKMDKLLHLFYHPVTQVICLLLGFGGWIWGQQFSYFTTEAYSIFFAVIILNMATNPKTIFKIEYPIMEYLGKISYGIYVYHWVIILVILGIMQRNHLFTGWAGYKLDFFLYPLVLGLTVLISHFSFFYFENYFLRWKKKFSKISME